MLTSSENHMLLFRVLRGIYCTGYKSAVFVLMNCPFLLNTKYYLPLQKTAKLEKSKLKFSNLF